MLRTVPNVYDLFNKYGVDGEPTLVITRVANKTKLTYATIASMYKKWRQMLREEWDNDTLPIQKTRATEPFKKTSDEQIAKMLKMYKQGKTLTQISKATGYSLATVKKRIREYETKSRPLKEVTPELLMYIYKENKKGKTLMYLCDELNMQYKQCYNALAKAKRYYDYKEDK